MQNDFTPELIEKAKQAKSSKELITLAKENKIELSAEEAKEYFERLNKSGELSDEELNGVAGGYAMPKTVSLDYCCERFGCMYCGWRGHTLHYCDSRNIVLHHKCEICKFHNVVGREVLCNIDTGYPDCSEILNLDKLINKYSERADRWKP